MESYKQTKRKAKTALAATEQEVARFKDVTDLSITSIARS